MNQSTDSQTVFADQDQWFDTASVLNDDWVVVKLTTPQGKNVQYRIPQNAYLEDIDADQDD